MDEDVRKFADTVKNKIEELNKTLDGNCWLCKKRIKNWICLIPKYDPDDLGFGSNGNKARLAFIPLCPEHDTEDPDIIKQLQKILVIKNQELKN